MTETTYERPARRGEGGDVLVEVHGLKVHFPIKRGVIFDKVVGHVYAVDGVDLEIHRGETYGLVGESGCGKSTLGKAILGLEPPTEGTVTIDGVEVGSLTGKQMRARRKDFQMVFQDPMSSLDPRQSVESLLVEGMKAHGLADDDKATAARLRQLLADVGLPAAALKKYPHEFSGGQRQRIGIARALSVEPKLIVADEPVSALDVSVQAQVINLLTDLQRELGIAYLFVAHDLAVVEHISHRVAVMYLGRIVEIADRETLFSDPRLSFCETAEDSIDSLTAGPDAGGSSANASGSVVSTGRNRRCGSPGTGGSVPDRGRASWASTRLPRVRYQAAARPKAIQAGVSASAPRPNTGRASSTPTAKTIIGTPTKWLAMLRRSRW